MLIFKALKVLIMRKIYLIIGILISLTAQSDSIDSNRIKEFQNKILNNDNIGKLEINYIYNNFLSIIEQIEAEKVSEKMLHNEYEFIMEYIEELMDKEIKEEEKSKIWIYIKENSSESRSELLKGRDKILKNLI